MASGIAFQKRIKGSGEKGRERVRSTIFKGLVGMVCLRGKVKFEHTSAWSEGARHMP